MIDKLFKFPIIMIDGNKEDEKDQMDALLNKADDTEDPEIIYGEAECPYYDFLSVSDRWLPSDESYNRALNGKFDACFVLFDRCGSFIVPWPKERFKKEFSKFSQNMENIDPLSQLIEKLKDR